MAPRKSTSSAASPKSTASKEKKVEDAAKKAHRKEKAGGKKPVPTVSEFLSHAKNLHVVISDGSKRGAAAELAKLDLAPRENASGSFGWHGVKRLTIELEHGGEKLQVQFQVNATVLGSKPASAGASAKADAEDADYVEMEENEEED